MSRSEILPPGVDDALPFLASTMAARPGIGSGRLEPRTPSMAFAALEGLVRHVGGLRPRLDALDGADAPDPDPLEWPARYFSPEGPANPDGALHLGTFHAWRILEALAPAVLSAEARARALEGLPPIAPPAESPPADPLLRIVDQVELDGGMHRDESAFWRSVESMIPRALDVEARVLAIGPRPRKAVAR